MNMLDTITELEKCFEGINDSLSWNGKSIQNENNQPSKSNQVQRVIHCSFSIIMTVIMPPILGIWNLELPGLRPVTSFLLCPGLPLGDFILS